jgi:hypothetical protein
VERIGVVRPAEYAYDFIQEIIHVVNTFLREPTVSGLHRD